MDAVNGMGVNYGKAVLAGAHWCNFTRCNRSHVKARLCGCQYGSHAGGKLCVCEAPAEKKKTKNRKSRIFFDVISSKQD